MALRFFINYDDKMRKINASSENEVEPGQRKKTRNQRENFFKPGIPRYN
jgi:hypothetical protein